MSKNSAQGIVRDSDRLPAFPWRDPQSVPPERLAQVISSLQEACAQNPGNARLHALLGIAYSMNYDVPASMDSLEEACRIDPGDFFARIKYSELFFRLRVMDRAEEEARIALHLAKTQRELALARQQLSEIRKLNRIGLTRPRWTKSPKPPGELITGQRKG